MYRRNISHLLYGTALVIMVIALYGAWIKPTYLQHLDSGSGGSPGPFLPGTTPALPAPEPVEPDPRPARLIDPGATPEAQDRETLAQIRDELEKGNLQLVESRLGSLSSAMLSDAAVRSYIAVLWNNLGIEQERIDGPRTSVRMFQKAAALDGANPVIQLNLAHAYWALRDPAMTDDFLGRLIALAPQDPFPHLAMAELLHERDQLEEAVRHLDRATELAGKDPAIRSYLRSVAAKVRSVAGTEEHLSTRESSHFIVKYDGAADPTTWTAVQDILEEAYREIGQKIGHFPPKPIVVVLHVQSTFYGDTGSPAWADGLFDPVLGRIHVPTQGALTDHLRLKRVLRHEFAHALLHDLQGFASSPVPTWFNEGLAIQLSGDHWSEIQPGQQPELAVIPLTALEEGWGHLSSDAATTAYLEASSAVHFLIDRYGLHGVHQILARLKAKQPFRSAVQSELSLSYEQFESRWMDRLNGELKTGSTHIDRGRNSVTASPSSRNVSSSAAVT